MALTAELPLSDGQTIEIDENEIMAIEKWYKFKKAQLESVDEVKEFRKAEGDPHGKEHFKVSIDPFDEEDWYTLAKGFLAAHGIIGWRNMSIASFIYYNTIEFNRDELKTENTKDHEK
jgi:hypothetical protein